MQILQFETLVAQIEDLRFGKEPGFFDRLRSNAGHALAKRIARDASLYERIDPTKEELDANPYAPVRHRWRVGIETNLSEIEARKRQMDEARREGRREAGAICRKMAASYRQLDDPCRHVLVQQLHDLAREIDGE